MMRATTALAAALVMACVAGAGDDPGFWAQATFIRGDVTSSPSGSPDEGVPVRRGDLLGRGARVRCGPDSRATLLLSDGSLLVVPPGGERAVEPSRAQDRPGLAEVAHNLTRTVAERGGTSPLLKHVGGLRDDRENLAVAPRHTRVRHGAVRLVWEAAPGVPRYLVRVLGPLGPTVAAEVAGRELVLEAGAVEPGAGYVWEIRDAADPSALVALGSGSFGVLDDHAADRLAAQEEEIAALRQVAAGDDSTPDFLAFQACREAELFLEALLRLEGLLATEPEDEALLGERDSLRVLLGLDDARVGMLLRESAGP